MITMLCFPLALILCLNSWKLRLTEEETIAGKYKILRKFPEPILDILLLPLTDDPDNVCLGLSPAYAARALALGKISISGTLAIIAMAEIKEIPAASSGVF